MNPSIVRLLFSTLLTFPIMLTAAEVLPLNGAWRLQLDRANAGEAQQWFGRELDDSVQLPGTLTAQGIGDDVAVDSPWIGSIFDPSYFTEPRFEPYRQPGNIKVPFWLQPDKYYAGAAWYQREVEIPAAWLGQRVVLTLERPHWKTTVWLDEREIGSDVSLSTPHVYDLGAAVSPGRHRLTIRVDNSLVVDIGANSHSISDHTQGNWNGVVGRIELSATPQVWAEDIRVYPDIETRSIRVRAILRNTTGQTAQGKISLAVAAGSGAAAIDVLPVTTNFNTPGDQLPVELEMALGPAAQLWDEFSPAVYQAEVTVSGEVAGTPFVFERQEPFGLRAMSTEGKQLLINGRKAFLRGTLECAIFPRTGHPPVDADGWRKVFRAVQAHGLNHVRFHSWCPPEAAFVAADEMGVYLQVEAASWPNQTTTLGDGKPVDAWLEAETGRILAAYGNHPSFVFMASSNEPGGPNASAWLSEWLQRWKTADSRRLYTSGAGWPQLPENDFHIPSEPRIQHWREGLESRINKLPPETASDYRDYINERTVPVVSHEIGQWCVYPNFAEMEKYTGYLKPRNFEIFRDWLEANGLGDQAHDFLIASGKLQALCYKEDIESALRTPAMGGFQLLDLHDFPGQGTALIGILDPFWEEKGYITPEEFSRFSGSTVPLVRLDKRVFTSAETLVAEVEISHFGAAPLANVRPEWKLVADDGSIAAAGTLDTRDVPVGGAIPLGRVTIDLAAMRAPAHYKLVVGMAATPIENDWDVWVYPAAVETVAPARVSVVDELDDAALATLDAGGTVFLQIPPDRVKGDANGPVQLGFSSIFWNTAWTNGQAPHTLGILCDPEHPAFGDFPTEFHSNWQWWYVVTNAAAMILDDLPAELHPTVQVIDDWFKARRLGLFFEARVGNGRLLVSSINFDRDANPVTRQLRASLLAYAATTDFDPPVELTPDQVRGLMQ